MDILSEGDFNKSIQQFDLNMFTVLNETSCDTNSLSCDLGVGSVDAIDVEMHVNINNDIDVNDSNVNNDVSVNNDVRDNNNDVSDNNSDVSGDHYDVSDVNMNNDVKENSFESKVCVTHVVNEMEDLLDYNDVSDNVCDDNDENIDVVMYHVNVSDVSDVEPDQDDQNQECNTNSSISDNEQSDDYITISSDESSDEHSMTVERSTAEYRTQVLTLTLTRRVCICNGQEYILNTNGEIDYHEFP